MTIGVIIRHTLIAGWIGFLAWFIHHELGGKVIIWTCDQNIIPHIQQHEI